MSADVAGQPGDGREVPALTLRAVVHDVVAEVAPEELPVVAGLSGWDDEKVTRRLLRARRRRESEPLGFGLETVVVLVTPVVWGAVQEVVNHVAVRTADGWLPRLRRRLGSRRHGRPAQQAIPPLTGEQLVRVRQRVIEMATEAGLAAERTEVLADRVVARLALPGERDRTETEENEGNAGAATE